MKSIKLKAGHLYEIKSKIYCKNCKYYCNLDKTCEVRVRHPLFHETYLDHRGEEVSLYKNKELYERLFKPVPLGSLCAPNTQFSCPLYERKWYLFWIKPKRGPKHLLVELMK